MDCQKAYHNLSAYLDNNLPPTIQVQISEHLKCCPDCRKRLSVFERILVSAVELGHLRAPDWIEIDVLTAIDKYETQRQKKEAFKLQESIRPRWMLGFSLGISAAIILMGLFFSSNMLSPRPQFAENSDNARNENLGAIDKSDLVIDNPGDVIKVVQDLHGDRYIMVRSERQLYGAGKAVGDIIQTPSVSYSTNGGNPYIVKTGAEIVF